MKRGFTKGDPVVVHSGRWAGLRGDVLRSVTRRIDPDLVARLRKWDPTILLADVETVLLVQLRGEDAAAIEFHPNELRHMDVITQIGELDV